MSEQAPANLCAWHRRTRTQGGEYKNRSRSVFD
jgi:hypothetical protein